MSFQNVFNGPNQPAYRSSWSRWEASLDGHDADPKEDHTPEGDCPHGPWKADLGYQAGKHDREDDACSVVI